MARTRKPKRVSGTTKLASYIAFTAAGNRKAAERKARRQTSPTGYTKTFKGVK